MRRCPEPCDLLHSADWLVGVPNHWSISALKRKLKVVNGGTPSSTEATYWDGKITWLTPEDLGKNNGKMVTNSRRQISLEGLENCGAQLVPRDSIVLSTRAPIGHLAITAGKACTNQGCRALVPREKTLSSSYYYYVLLSSREILQAIGKGTTFMELGADALGLHKVPVPSTLEQVAIASFLDKKTTEIDALVAKKRALIEKLKEKRSALISATVTRGLPPEAARAAGLEPNPRIESSGVEWLGSVPTHWAVAQLRRKVLILDCKHRTVPFVDEGIPLASIQEVHGLQVDLSSAKKTTEEEYLQMIEGDRAPRIGDIIYSRNATVGDAALVTTSERFCMGQDVCLIRGVKQCSKFLLYLFRSRPLTEQVESLMIGSTFRRINVGQIKAFWVCMPPLSEQRAIADFLDRETAKINALLDKIEQAIERLQEYRTAVITAAVTGKIDVWHSEKAAAIHA